MDLLADLHGVLDALADSDPFSLSDAESVLSLERARARLEAVLSRSVGAFDEGGEWAGEGAQSAPAWLSTRCHLPLAEARRQVRRGRALWSLPVVAQAFCGGEIGVAQVDRLVKAARAVHGVDPEIFATMEETLVTTAKELTFAPFCAAVDYFTQRADPEGALACDLAQAARRDVYLYPSLGGMYLGAMNLDPFSGAIVAAELERRQDELYEADRAAAQATLGREPRPGELARTGAQRRADALVEMAVRSAGAQGGARRPAPLFSVLVGYETLYGRICRLEGGPIVSPGALLPYLEGADFERIVFAPNQRIECSVRARFFSGATRRAIEVRDQECTDAFCETPAQKCQIDHILPFSQGGATTQDNGRVLCGFHNRLRNHAERSEEPYRGESGEEIDDEIDDEGGP